MPVAGISLDNWTSQYDNNAHHCTIVYAKVIHSQIFYWDRPSSTTLLCASSEGPDETALCAGSSGPSLIAYATKYKIFSFLC